MNNQKPQSEKKNEFNGYSFDEKNMRKRMKYVLIFRGDLDLNGAYAFNSLRSLKKYIRENGSLITNYAIFEIKKDLSKLLNP